ncbi:MAG TPA: VWA domain-containing protein [Pyrinomonadaceae bacterium]
MRHFCAPSLLRVLFPAIIFLSLPVAVARAQSGEQTDDVLRIKTELVQTDVMVFDKQGRFVEGLLPEQFELSLDGKTQTVSFFERLTAGSSTEAAQLAASRRTSNAPTKDATTVSAASTVTEQGRVIFFFIDDLHTSGASLIRAREALQSFVDNQMRPNDQVAVVSTSGQIGFLQQLTDNPAVLRAAIKRLNYKQNPETYTGNTQISEYMASQVLDNGNRELYAYLLESIKVEQQSGPGNRHGDHRLASSYSAAPLLRNRLRQVDAQGRMTTADTLESLRNLMLSASALPGRKLVLFFSDGFIINERKSGALETLHRVTEAAARSGAVVYTMDLRGTFFGLGSGVDASTNDYIDLSARRVGVAAGEINATREPLQLIADETGGRAIFNSNSISDAISQAIRETSDYYLLAWRPDSEAERDARSRIKISIKDHPELRVRLRNNFLNPAPTVKTEVAKTGKEAEAKTASTQQSSEVELLSALGSLYPRHALPVTLSVGHLNTTGNNFALKVSMQIERADVDAGERAQKAEVDVIGVAIDDRGQFSSFKQLLTIVPDSSSQQPVIWNQQLNVKPGLYQVRVAVRERASGRTGSAMTWIEVPDSGQARFQMSSLFLGERSEAAGGGDPSPNSSGAQAVTVDVDHHFARTSVLRFQTYVYNAARGADGADVWVQAQVFRNRQQVMSIAPGKAPTTSDSSRLPYWSEISLNQLPPGQYTLQVSATDRIGKTSASQRVNFSID